MRRISLRRLPRAAAVLGALGALGAFAAMPATAQQIPSLGVESFTLPNGLRVLMHQDHSTPIVAVEMFYHVGSGDEQRGRTGFAHLFEHVMFMGSVNVPVGASDRMLESAGAGDVNGSTWQDRTNYYVSVPSNALPLALWLEADRMGFLLPTMDQQKLDVQRDIVKNERREGVDNAPYGRADETILAALFPPSHPYSWDVIGSMDDLSAASLADVTDFFRTFYAPNNATLVISGDFAPDSARRLVTTYFADIPRGAAAPRRPTIPPVALPRDTFLVLEDRVQLPRFWYAWHTTKAFAPDDAALDVLAYILAGDKNSRLYKSLVYDAQVAQDVNAGQRGGRLDGYFTLDVTPKPGRTPAELARLVDRELDRIATRTIDARELERARNTIRAQFLDRLASALGKAHQLAYYDYFTGTPDYVRQDAERYDRVTAADVQRVAQTYLRAPKVVLTIVPDGKTPLALRGAR